MLYTHEPAIAFAVTHVGHEAGTRGADWGAGRCTEIHAGMQKHVAGDRVDAVSEARADLTGANRIADEERVAGGAVAVEEFGNACVFWHEAIPAAGGVLSVEGGENQFAGLKQVAPFVGDYFENDIETLA
ncbi:MAG: hypothetical protein ACO33A_10790, partial [Hyphomonas sp.]